MVMDQKLSALPDATAAEVTDDARYYLSTSPFDAGTGRRLTHALLRQRILAAYDTQRGALLAASGVAGVPEAIAPPAGNVQSYMRFIAGFPSWQAGTPLLTTLGNVSSGVSSAAAADFRTAINITARYRGAWSSSATYAIGDYVIHGGRLWLAVSITDPLDANDHEPGTVSGGGWGALSGHFRGTATATAQSYVQGDHALVGTVLYFCVASGSFTQDQIPTSGSWRRVTADGLGTLQVTDPNNTTLGLVSGNLIAAAITAHGGTLTTEQVQDIAGAMWAGQPAHSYDDPSGTMDALVLTETLATDASSDVFGHVSGRRLAQAVAAHAGSGGTLVSANPTGGDGARLVRVRIGTTNWNVRAGSTVFPTGVAVYDSTNHRISATTAEGYALKTGDAVLVQLPAALGSATDALELHISPGDRDFPLLNFDGTPVNAAELEPGSIIEAFMLNDSGGNLRWYLIEPTDLTAAEAVDATDDRFGLVSGERLAQAVMANERPVAHDSTLLGAGLGADLLSVNINEVIEALTEDITYWTDGTDYPENGATAGQVYTTSAYQKDVHHVSAWVDRSSGNPRYTARIFEVNASNEIVSKLGDSAERSDIHGTARQEFYFPRGGVSIPPNTRIAIVISRSDGNHDVLLRNGTEATASPTESYDDASNDFNLVADVAYSASDPEVGRGTHHHGTNIRGNIKISYTVTYHHGSFIGAGKADTDLQNIDADLTDAEKTVVQTRLGLTGFTPVTQTEAEAGTEAGLRAWSPLRVAQAIAALGSGGGGLSTEQIQDLVGAMFAGQAGISYVDATGVMTTPPYVSQALAEAGTSSILTWWSPLRVAQAIAALAPSGVTDYDDLTDKPIVRGTRATTTPSAANADALLLDTGNARLYRNALHPGHGATASYRAFTTADLRTKTSNNDLNYRGEVDAFGFLPQDPANNDVYFTINDSHFVQWNGDTWLLLTVSDFVPGFFETQALATTGLGEAVGSGTGVGRVIAYPDTARDWSGIAPHWVTAYTAPVANTRTWADYLAGVIGTIQGVVGRLPWKGAWAAGSYRAGDIVTNGGRVWLALTDTSATAEYGNHTAWTVIASNTNWRGAWLATAYYATGEMVLANGNVYLKTGASGNENITDPSWTNLSAGGGTGRTLEELQDAVAAMFTGNSAFSYDDANGEIDYTAPTATLPDGVVTAFEYNQATRVMEWSQQGGGTSTRTVGINLFDVGNVDGILAGLWMGTQAQFDALATKAATTVYFAT